MRERSILKIDYCQPRGEEWFRFVSFLFKCGFQARIRGAKILDWLVAAADWNKEVGAEEWQQITVGFPGFAC
ncbi:MAG: hypothetical protein WCJ07_10690 [Verrucomicrobiota bacterium]